MSLFSQDQLAKLVAETLPADAKPGDKVIVATVDATGAKAIISFNKQSGGANWQLQWATAYAWKGDVQTGAKVIVRW
jgi:isocitrate lyase